ncbi:thiamine pyrophosphate-dependent dehydrogenase E1 component subunit alpha [Corallococcus sp. H22C18031201]|uniref:thiamine pyrophosphate-dependent dehydrogenase E1 component subunit alpha n=1 Tax=Citreicoccus inhibens TaxID=2849499 RepID=UPI000E71748E|nr:thiamine pyrophosphate-dependent dehydrogenase E1 component subunit alpha [Citreicoccus inhibens]MBU8896508.1 thiamine pyrophosphate-dependent dehydrogenase E1 component subunit alpha [Citreicoccus inhibens]RJS18848.1 thiamine pyrophosphate-dependent dehydrogenase E1 component subunit alpha [Corallococcus sp. H22C18031201]
MSRPRLIKEASAPLPLERELLIRIHDLMVKARVLEERLIQMYKQGHGYFWIGGPGEEAFNVPLGLLMKVGQGPAYDFLHAHYRQSATLLAMGEEPIGALRQMKNTASDPYSGGRNFAGHFSIRAKNVVPVSSPIEVQYAMAPGTALAQKRLGGDSITIVTGGDAGTAEGDFASCLVWCSRPAEPLPVLMIVTNNKWGISTSGAEQHGEQRVADRGRAFGIQCKTINGNDPVEAYQELKEAMAYVRKERRPFLLEANVSRLYGHSSASGANLVTEEVDCLKQFEARLEQDGVLTRQQMDDTRNRYAEEMAAAARLVRDEPLPAPETIWNHIYAEKK